MEFPGHHLHEHRQIAVGFDKAEWFYLFTLCEGYLGASLVGIFLQGLRSIARFDLQSLFLGARGQFEEC